MIEKYTALYSPLDIEYAQIMSGPYTTLTFHDFDNCDGVCIAAFKNGKISGYWRPMVCFGNEKYQKFQIEELWKGSQDIFYQDFLIGGQISPVTKFLLQKDYTATPYYTQIIDLTKSTEELHAELRKSYKSLVNKYPVYDCTIKPIKDLRFKLKGQTRPDKTWDIQEQMRIKNQAFILASGKVGRLTLNADAAGLFYYNKDWVYYASGVSEIDSHHILWAAILMAKGLGCKWFEMGEQVFSGEEKLVNISSFKRGFGGKTIVRLNLTR